MVRWFGFVDMGQLSTHHTYLLQPQALARSDDTKNLLSVVRFGTVDKAKPIPLEGLRSNDRIAEKGHQGCC